MAWTDWEALKLAALLRYPAHALEAGLRLGKRAPTFMWDERETTPSRVAFALAKVAPPPGSEDQEPWLRILDQLVSQALDDEDLEAATSIRKFVVTGEGSLAEPSPGQEAEIDFSDDLEALWLYCAEQYKAGVLREDDLLMDPRFEPLSKVHDLVDLLRIRRGFG